MNPFQDRVSTAQSLFGSVPAEMTLEEAQEKCGIKYEGIDRYLYCD